MTDTSATPQSEDSFELPTDAEHIEYTVKHPLTGAPTAARITLAGITHPVRKAALFGRMRTLMASADAERYELEAADEDETAFAATCTLGWSGISTGGAPRIFALGGAQVLYSDPKYRWLRDQVREALRQREPFINAVATT